jgi:hypothetical protein
MYYAAVCAGAGRTRKSFTSRAAFVESNLRGFNRNTVEITPDFCPFQSKMQLDFMDVTGEKLEIDYAAFKQGFSSGVKAKIRMMGIP